ncbi:hypothetical protein GO755_03355 [Spirosoma sp. HMF4905]|uniref:Uncharacterized protein n=1 Tax=Spirosoma arboris TaxID=2682092 RepID=A0A7K1S5N3_9BACT|nr:hypothetical protein [Spirosoma arboris]MVM29055.1 hypothetical protein [Spirosoma arboris]
MRKCFGSTARTHDLFRDIKKSYPNDTIRYYAWSPSLLVPSESTRLIDLSIQLTLLGLPTDSAIYSLSIYAAGAAVSVKEDTLLA